MALGRSTCSTPTPSPRHAGRRAAEVPQPRLDPLRGLRHEREARCLPEGPLLSHKLRPGGGDEHRRSLPLQVPVRSEAALQPGALRGAHGEPQARGGEAARAAQPALHEQQGPAAAPPEVRGDFGGPPGRVAAPVRVLRLARRGRAGAAGGAAELPAAEGPEPEQQLVRGRGGGGAGRGPPRRPGQTPGLEQRDLGGRSLQAAGGAAAGPDLSEPRQQPRVQGRGRRGAAQGGLARVRPRGRGAQDLAVRRGGRGGERPWTLPVASVDPPSSAPARTSAVLQTHP
eukprot:CAMPEP_0175418326 /NCGR_PEP_ID=MMETSP0095-20121207/45656_1 /TAXON_ID=311494 /ORGANISM="Alexandrium monilatum, Strain CCMP3105" /LENGTH=284 /DNA_ID=CAMNT_0016717483 /DNA_START=70 /DNA_END=924 /DNA_ORIENTATION=+